MAAGFTEQEKDIIRKQLKENAKECMKLYGVKKTTVDELVSRVGISKGAFYKFYETKEHLCFEVIEDYHTEVFGEALNILKTRTDLEEKDRLAEALLTACRLMKENSMMDIMENDIVYLLRKLPTEVTENHYHSDDDHFKYLIEASGIKLKASTEFVSSVIRALMLGISHRKQIGEKHFGEVMELLIRGACDKLWEIC